MPVFTDLFSWRVFSWEGPSRVHRKVRSRSYRSITNAILLLLVPFFVPSLKSGIFVILCKLPPISYSLRGETWRSTIRLPGFSPQIFNPNFWTTWCPNPLAFLALRRADGLVSGQHLHRELGFTFLPSAEALTFFHLLSVCTHGVWGLHMSPNCIAGGLCVSVSGSCFSIIFKRGGHLEIRYHF